MRTGKLFCPTARPTPTRRGRSGAAGNLSAASCVAAGIFLLGALGDAVAQAPPQERAHSDMVIQWVRRQVVKADEQVFFVASVRNTGRWDSSPVPFEWLLNGERHSTGTRAGLRAGDSAEISYEWHPVKGSHLLEFRLPKSRRSLQIRTDALSVWIGIEKKTYDALSDRVRSIEAGLQDSFQKLHESFRQAIHPVLAPEGILEFFRIDRIDTYKRSVAEPLPAAFREHPDHDLFIAIDEGGASTGYDPQQRSIVLNVRGSGAAEPDSLLPPSVELALYREIVLSRGVPRYQHLLPTKETVLVPFANPHSRIAGWGFPEGVEDLTVQLGQLAWSPYTAYYLNWKRGAAEPAGGGNPGSLSPELWKQIPGTIFVAVRDRENLPVPKAKLSVYRAEPRASQEPPAYHFAAESRPVKTAETDVRGELTLVSQELFGGQGESPPTGWVLLRVQGERAEALQLVNLLEMNLAFWSGSEEQHRLTVRLAQ